MSDPGHDAGQNQPPRFSTAVLAAAGLTVAGWFVFFELFSRRLFAPYIFIPLGVGLLAFWLCNRTLAEVREAGGAVKGKGLAVGLKLFSAILAVVSIWAGMGEMGGFMKFQDKAKQSEAKVNLYSEIPRAQAEFSARNNRPATSFNELGWKPDSAKPRYAYFIAGDALQPAGENYPLPAEVKAGLASGKYAAAAVSNIDRDPTLDVWAITPEKELIKITDDVAE